MTPMYKFQGWMRGTSLIWRAVCASNGEYDCFLIMRKLRVRDEWSSSVVLPFMETPVRSSSMHDGGLQ